jgi:hypothetical protein
MLTHIKNWLTLGLGNLFEARMKRKKAEKKMSEIQIFNGGSHRLVSMNPGPVHPLLTQVNAEPQVDRRGSSSEDESSCLHTYHL